MSEGESCEFPNRRKLWRRTCRKTKRSSSRDGLVKRSSVRPHHIIRFSLFLRLCHGSFEEVLLQFLSAFPALFVSRLPFSPPFASAFPFLDFSSFQSDLHHLFFKWLHFLQMIHLCREPELMHPNASIGCCSPGRLCHTIQAVHQHVGWCAA